jgi:glutathione S-transferase
MTKPKLTYFDAPVSRGEECRLALAVAGVDFEDVRIQAADWPALKSTSVFGSMPIFEIEGHPPLAQSNAILTLIGRRHGLHPKDDFEAARHESLMGAVEDLRTAIGPTTRMQADEKKKARIALAETRIPMWATHVERFLDDRGPFFAGDKLNVVDLKLYMIVRWLKSGVLDDIPATILDSYPRLNRIFNAVGNHPAVKAWTAKH